MKTKEFDIERSGYDEKVQSIKKRKRSLKMLQDPDMIKRIKKDLTKEKRSAKRGERSKLNIYLKEEIDKYGRKDE
jgi:membrane protease subunit (stomatin/prohibitin family)